MKLLITNEAHRAISSSKHRQNPLKPMTGVQRTDGRWQIDLDSEVLKGLRSKQLRGESLSDTIVRLIDIDERGLQ